VQTNTFLAADTVSSEAVVIDPAGEGRHIAAEARRRKWHIQAVWITHAHFDHIGGTASLLREVKPQPDVALHPSDLFLWQMQGGAPLFGFQVEPGSDPSLTLHDRQELRLGELVFQVRHTPGHTPGHVVYYCASAEVVFCGDVIFAGSIGRTDLPGGDFNTLINSIRQEILTLPDETRLYSGHGPQTTVGVERQSNPYLA
jgi:glyoxylase-like metal-dependent hydrolase (beta-lactamase superfamily II)